MLQLFNFAQGTVSTGYDAAATSIALTTGHGARFPSVGPFRCVWWNSTDYPNPADDPNREIVEVTARSTDTLTITRGHETSFGGVAASTKNTASKTYSIALVDSAETKMRDRSDPDREVFFFDDFLYRGTASGDGVTYNPQWRHIPDGNSIAVNWKSNDTIPTGLLDAGRSGEMKIISDTVSERAGVWQIRSSFGLWGPFQTGGEMTFETELFMPAEAVSNATDDYTFRIGLGLHNSTYANVGDGIWFEYNHATNSGNWRASTRSTSQTDVNSSVAVTAGGLARLKFVRNAAATSVEFFIDGASIGSASTNIFGNQVSSGIFMWLDRAAGTARRCTWVDWVRFTQHFSSR